jgi:hypothetical protein
MHLDCFNTPCGLLGLAHPPVPLVLVIGLFLLIGVYSFVATLVMICRGRYDSWLRGIADLLVYSFILGFACGTGWLAFHAMEGFALIPGFVILAGSGLALAVGLLIRSRTGGGFGPTPNASDAAAEARRKALAAKALKFVGAPPEAIAAVTAPPPKPRMSIPVLSRPNPCAAPPRPVPSWVRLQVLFGGYLNQFGWLFLGFGMIAVWLFVCRADLTSWYRFRGPLETAPGRVIASSDTGASVGGSKHSRGTPVYKNEFSFVVDGKEYRGVSYATGRQLSARRAVTVEYLPAKPQVSRIQGMRTNVFGPEVIFAVLFPLVGLGIVIAGLRRGVRECDLLANGVPTSARLLSKEPTGSRVNNRMVYKYTFTFKTLEDQVCQASDNTDADRFVDDAEEHIVYDPRRPERAVLLDNLPGAPEIGEDGHLIGHRPMLALGYCILPLATILGHGYWALRILTR